MSAWYNMKQPALCSYVFCDVESLYGTLQLAGGITCNAMALVPPGSITSHMPDLPDHFLCHKKLHNQTRCFNILSTKSQSTPRHRSTESACRGINRSFRRNGPLRDSAPSLFYLPTATSSHHRQDQIPRKFSPAPIGNTPPPSPAKAASLPAE